MDLLHNKKEIIMAHLIDKDTLIEKLWERRIKHLAFGGSPYSEYGHEDDEILSLINALEVKEVDFEKEIKEEYLKRRCYGGRDNMFVILNEPQFNKIAKHFYKLGLKAQKGE